MLVLEGSARVAVRFEAAFPSRPAGIWRDTDVQVEVTDRAGRTAVFDDSPLILTIWSPDWMPACAAGVSSIGDTIVSTPSLSVISMPSPPNSPFTSVFISL